MYVSVCVWRPYRHAISCSQAVTHVQWERALHNGKQWQQRTCTASKHIQTKQILLQLPIFSMIVYLLLCNCDPTTMLMCSCRRSIFTNCHVQLSARVRIYLLACCAECAETPDVQSVAPMQPEHFDLWQTFGHVENHVVLITWQIYEIIFPLLAMTAAITCRLLVTVDLQFICAIQEHHSGTTKLKYKNSSFFMFRPWFVYFFLVFVCVHASPNAQNKTRSEVSRVTCHFFTKSAACSKSCSRVDV